MLSVKKQTYVYSLKAIYGHKYTIQSLNKNSARITQINFYFTEVWLHLQLVAVPLSFDFPGGEGGYKLIQPYIYI